MAEFMLCWWFSRGWRLWFTSDEYQQDGDNYQQDEDVIYGDLHLMSTSKMVIAWSWKPSSRWAWAEIKRAEGRSPPLKDKKNQKLFPQKTSPKSQTKSIDRGGGIKIKKTYQTFDRYARGRYTVGKSVGKKSGGEIFYRATMIPNQKAKKMQFNSSLVERSSECQDTFLVEVAALRSFIDAKAFKCNTAPHCNVIGRHCTIREIRSSQSMLKPETFSVHKNIGRLTTTKYIMAYWQVVSHSTRWSSSFILGPLHWSSIFIFLTSREHKNIVQWCTNWQATLAQYFTCCYSSLAT